MWESNSAEASTGETAKATALRNQYRDSALAGITSALDPASPDYMHFGESSQTLVDSSFLALALLRAPKQLLQKLDATTQQRLAAALVTQRQVQPPFNNWLLLLTPSTPKPLSAIAPATPAASVPEARTSSVV